LTSALDGGDWSGSRCGPFVPGERATVPIVRRLGGPQSRSGRRGVEKSLLALSEWV
jgi:hypothetical protein